MRKNSLLNTRSLFVVLVVFLFTLLSTNIALAQDTTITFLTPPWGVPPDEEALAAFTAETGIAVEIQSVQLGDLFSRVQVSAATGQVAADVIFLTEEAPSNVVATGNMMSLNDLLEMSDLDTEDIQNIEFWTVDGNVYGISTYLQMVMMDYNSAKLAEAGFDEAPATWDEFAEMAAAAKEAGIEEFPIAFGAIDWSWYLMALSMGDAMFDDDLNPVFADEDSQGRRAMEMLLGFFEDELISPEMLAGSSQHTIFWSGTGIFHQGWQGSVSRGNSDTSLQSPNVDYLLLPEEHYTWSLAAGIGIAEGSENVDAAWEFVQWYVGEQNQTDIFNAFGLIPSRTSVQEELAANDALDGIDTISEQSNYLNELPRYTLWWGPFTDAVSEAILEAAQTDMTADEVIDNLAEEWNELREEFE